MSTCRQTQGKKGRLSGRKTENSWKGRKIHMEYKYIDWTNSCQTDNQVDTHRDRQMGRHAGGHERQANKWRDRQTSRQEAQIHWLSTPRGHFGRS